MARDKTDGCYALPAILEVYLMQGIDFLSGSFDLDYIFICGF